MKVDFQSKGHTLLRLAHLLQSARVAPIRLLTHREFINNKQDILKDIFVQFKGKSLIVRSSALNEDSEDASNAGVFLSVLHVSSVRELESAVEDVFASYDIVDEASCVLIQPMIEDVVCSGVAFTHDASSGAPYRIINWSIGADTSAVTGGQGDQNLWIQAAISNVVPPAEIRDVIPLIEELCEIYDGKPLDLEFAISRTTGKTIVWLLQVRPLIVSSELETPEDQFHRLKSIYDRITDANSKQPYLAGDSNVYGVMPDWNPAEMIGIRPRPLSLSLYRELISDNIWAYQRNNYGYRDLRSFPLIVNFYGLPYVDTRISFNSFIPKKLDDKLAHKLANYYISKLKENPHFHDKIEFDIVFSCFVPGMQAALSGSELSFFNKSEQEIFFKELKDITNKTYFSKERVWPEDIKKIEALSQKRDAIMKSKLSLLSKLYWLIEDCKRYGTLPFAGLARMGFVAVQYLKSLITLNVISEDDYEGVIRSVNTVGAQIGHDRSNLSFDEFIELYGHIRPGSYDILSARYDECPEIYFSEVKACAEASRGRDYFSETFQLSDEKLKKLSAVLKHDEIDVTPLELLEFIKLGIFWRERAKFEFTKNLSLAISLIKEIGSQYGFSEEELSYVDYACFKEGYVSLTDMGEAIGFAVQAGKRKYSKTLKTMLPPIIVDPSQVFGYSSLKFSPNFVTNKRASGSVCYPARKEYLDGAIVFIESADPGYDWIFSYPIAGLVTAWGGANSHMAIRASELGIPAVIGIGEAAFRDYSRADALHIDCASEIIRVGTN